MRSRRRVFVCSACHASFASLSPGWFKLTYCAPHKLGPLGCRRCVGYLYHMCFLDRPLARPDWDRMAHRQPPIEVEQFLGQSRQLESGALPVVDVPTLAAQLAPGEVVHHVSRPVFTAESYLPGAREDGGELYVTNCRLLFCAAGSCSSFPFADFEELRPEYPGFYVRFRGEHVLHRFFPPSLDPVFAAAVGALNRFRQPKTAEQG